MKLSMHMLKQWFAAFDPVATITEGAREICAMNADGSGKRLLVTLDCVLDLYDTETFLGAVTEDGVTYLCLAYREPLENHWYESGFEYGLSPDTLIVNTETGETVTAVWKGKDS